MVPLLKYMPTYRKFILLPDSFVKQICKIFCKIATVVRLISFWDNSPLNGLYYFISLFETNVTANNYKVRTNSRSHLFINGRFISIFFFVNRLQ